MWVSERDSSEKAENRTEHAAERCVTGMERIGADIRKLVSYGLKTGLVPREDEIFTINRLLELFGLEEPGACMEGAAHTDRGEEPGVVSQDEGGKEPAGDGKSDSEEESKALAAELEEILNRMCDYAYEKGFIAENGVVYRDLFDTKIMSMLLPRPSEVIRTFWELYEKESPRAATDYYYKFSRDSDYIRRYRIARDMKWIAPTKYGDLDITINLSKPEKDPKAIAAARNARQSGYPKCLLCRENEGYAGRINHPARQNHRIIPVTINGSQWEIGRAHV